MARPTKLVPAEPKPRLPPADRALPITKFAKAYGVNPSTVWRALRAGRLKAVVIGKRKLVLIDSVQSASP
jgi:hypothetical protein